MSKITEGKAISGLNSKPGAGFAAPSTVGRGRRVAREEEPESKIFIHDEIFLCCGDSLDYYNEWLPPDVIISDGGYGILGFEGDTSDHLDLPEWYEPHIRQWSEKIPRAATLWFWNSEVGWAAVHPVLEKYGWRYVSCNIWNKGKAHIAGNVNTSKIRHFPIVTEVCVKYVKEVYLNGMTLQKWLYQEWKRTGLPLRKANEACGVKDAAVRKYLDQGHLWYFPPPEAFEKLAAYANTHGKLEGRPYFSEDGNRPISLQEWSRMRAKFKCPHGVTNVWDRGPVNGKERAKTPFGKVVHLNQKPLDLTKMIIEASSVEGDVVWEPFGGLFTGCLAAYQLRRKAYGAEFDPAYYNLGIQRFKSQLSVLGFK